MSFAARRLRCCTQRRTAGRVPSQLVADVMVNLPGALPPRVHRGPDTDALAQLAKIRKLRIL
ncbi:protein of unknown function [Paraburkholderia kururiensis]